MLTIEEFRTAIIVGLSNRNTRPDVTFIPRDIKKNNDVTCLAITTVQSGDGKSTSVSPVAYLEDYYKAYKDGRSLAECIDFIEQAFENNSKPNGIDEFTNKLFEFDEIKDHLFLTAVNADRNKELLENAPHLMKEDIAFVCRVALSEDGEGIGSVLVRNNLLAAWGVTADEVCAIAKENTPKLFPAEVTSMAQMLREMMVADGMPSEMVDEFIDVGPMNDSMYVVTNKQKIHGAVATFYDGVLDDLAKKLDSEKLYILPSSIHEVIVVGSAVATNADDLSGLVHEVNTTEVSAMDQLSDHAYCYDTATKTFSSAS